MQTDNADLFVKDVALQEIRKSILLDIICGLEFIFRAKKTLVIPVRFLVGCPGLVTTFQRDKLVNETRQPPIYDFQARENVFGKFRLFPGRG